MGDMCHLWNDLLFFYVYSCSCFLFFPFLNHGLDWSSIVCHVTAVFSPAAWLNLRNCPNLDERCSLRNNKMVCKENEELRKINTSFNWRVLNVMDFRAETIPSINLLTGLKIKVMFLKSPMKIKLVLLGFRLFSKWTWALVNCDIVFISYY